MADDDFFCRFQWQDRYGHTWHVGFDNYVGGFSGFAASKDQRGTSSIYVQTHEIHAGKLSMAFLNDVRVDDRIDNRGLGSMLVRVAMEVCKQRGHMGLYGHLSEVDRDHFPKLKHFYEKLGFSVVFYDGAHPDYKFNRVGKIEMIFNNTRA